MSRLLRFWLLRWLTWWLGVPLGVFGIWLGRFLRVIDAACVGVAAELGLVGFYLFGTNEIIEICGPIPFDIPEAMVPGLVTLESEVTASLESIWVGAWLDVGSACYCKLSVGNHSVAIASPRREDCGYHENVHVWSCVYFVACRISRMPLVMVYVSRLLVILGGNFMCWLGV